MKKNPHIEAPAEGWECPLCGSDLGSKERACPNCFPNFPMPAIEQVADTFASLAARWADEKEYEDFNDYIAAMRDKVESLGLTFESYTKKPMVLKCSDRASHYMLQLTRTSITVKQADKITRTN